MSQLTPFVLFRCDCGCGNVTKIDISKYTKRVQRGLKQDYGFRPLPMAKAQEPHNCPTCGKKCKAENGAGTVAALEIEHFSEIHQKMMKVLAAHGPATLDEIRLYLDVEHDYKTSPNALHSRISELRAWRLVESVEQAEPTKPTGTRYESSPYVKYRLDRARAEIVQCDGWQTFRLKLMDGCASFSLEGFSQA